MRGCRKRARTGRVAGGWSRDQSRRDRAWPGCSPDTHPEKCRSTHRFSHTVLKCSAKYRLRRPGAMCGLPPGGSRKLQRASHGQIDWESGGLFPDQRYDTHNPFQRVGYEYGIRKVGAGCFTARRRWTPTANSCSRRKSKFTTASAARFGTIVSIERGGFLLQSSISWYPQRQTWDLAPGYNQSAHHPHFERPVTADCLYCHADRIEPIPGTLNRYREPVNLQPIGCEALPRSGRTARAPTREC